MRSYARIALVGLVVAASIAVAAPAAQAAFGVEKFLAGVCKVNTCTAASPNSDFFTQAAGHPNFGITDFSFNTVEPLPGLHVPDGAVKNIRVDLPPGLSVNPQTTPQCSEKEVSEVLEVAIGGPGPSPKLAECKVGVNLLSIVTKIEIKGIPTPVNVTLPVNVYNVVPPNGHGLAFGFRVAPLPPTYLIGDVSWNTDYHEYFTISNISNAAPLVGSRMVFEGRVGEGDLLTNPSSCTGPQTTLLKAESYAGESVEKSYTTPVGADGCNLVPFEPALNLLPATTQSDQPDGATTEVIVPQFPAGPQINSSTVKDASVTLPEGMTLNPPAADGLEACTAAQIGIGTTNPVACPAASQVGSVAIETRALPPGSLRGKVFLGENAAGPITGPPYLIYLDAESERYGLSVRLKGTVSPDPSTGRLTTTFSDNPPNPFTRFVLNFNSGAHAPIANPLTCGPAKTESSLSPFTGEAAASPFSTFTVDNDNNGGACPSPLPFSLSQSTQSGSANAGAFSPFTLNLARANGQQYLGKVKTTLPAGLLGSITSVPLCEEPQAAQGTCAAASKLGDATVTVGAGTSPLTFSGPAYLTGPYNGAPYGMSIPVPAVAGPFNLGTIVTRAQINVDPYTSRLIVTASVPTIVGGIPLRLRTLSVAVNRSNFLFNPTNCGALATESTLTSTFGATQNVSTPFQVANCSALAFKPSFSASAGGRTSKANGASLGVKIGYPKGPQANIRSVFVQLPKQLPSRLTTLQKACPEATFNANPFACPAGSRVGGATVTTPVLPKKLTGPAFFVSHGGAAFPDLDLVLSGNGVEVILVGNTNIKGAITTSTFAAIPDVPVSSFELNLPVGKNSALTANGKLCTSTLTMPTQITAQSGKQIKQNTKLSVTNCPVEVTAHKVKGTTAVLTVRTFAAGRISGSGDNLKTVTRHLSKAAKATLKVPLSSNGVKALRRHHKLKVKVRVGFVPKKKGPTSKTYVTVTFKG